MTTPEGASRIEADAAATPTHHAHHPENLNADVVRGRISSAAILAAAITAAVTVGGVIWFAVAIGGAK